MPGVAELQFVVAAADVEDQIAHFAAQAPAGEVGLGAGAGGAGFHLPRIGDKEARLHAESARRRKGRWDGCGIPGCG